MSLYSRLFMLNKHYASLHEYFAMVIADDLVPHRRHVTVIRTQGRVQRGTELNAAIFESGHQV